MSPKPLQNRSKLGHAHDNIYAKKLNRILSINGKLRKRIAALRVQNKSMSAARNVILLENIQLKNERNVIEHANHQLRALIHTGNRKLNALEYDLRSCVPALVTLSNCIPSMMNSVREISQLNKFNEFKTGKTERLSESIKRMVNMSPIVEIPEQCSLQMSAKKSSSPIVVGQVYLQEPSAESPSEPRSETLSTTRLEPNSELYFSLKDESSGGEVPSWLYSQENQNADIIADSSVTTVSENSDNLSYNTASVASLIPANEISIPVCRVEISTSNAVQVDIMSTSSSSSDGCEKNVFHENEIHVNGTMSPDPNMLKNITVRRYRKQSSNK